MATITEDYVSFETAKLLKEKGFPQEYDIYHSMVYNEEDYEDEYEVQRMVLETKLVKAGTLSSYPVGVPEPKCYCCTLQMAMKWLREVHKLHIIAEPCLGEGNEPNLSFNRWFWTILKEEGEYKPIRNIDEFSTYEQACEEAILYCLKNLI